MVPVDYLAVLVCGIVAMILGFLWYGVLFGKAWMALEGISPERMAAMKSDPAAKRKTMGSYAIQFVSALIMAYVLAHMLIIVSVFDFGPGILEAGLSAGFWSWLGFVVPPTLGMVLWEGKPWKLWILINGYWLLLLLIMGTILALWA